MAAITIHQGEHLPEELRHLDMSAAELVRKLDVPTNRIMGILNGERAVTGDTALRLGHFFAMSPQFWLNLQSLYELRVEQKKAGKAIRALPKLKLADRTPAWPEPGPQACEHILACQRTFIKPDRVTQNHRRSRRLVDPLHSASRSRFGDFLPLNASRLSEV